MDTNLILKGIGVFLITFVGIFLIFWMLINPMVQDSYNKGYLRGLNETCNQEWFFKNPISENWNDDSPFGNNNIIMPNFSLNIS